MVSHGHSGAVLRVRLRDQHEETARGYHLGKEMRVSREEIEFPKATPRALARGALLGPLLTLGHFPLDGKSVASRTVSQNESSSRQTPVVVVAEVPKSFLVMKTFKALR